MNMNNCLSVPTLKNLRVWPKGYFVRVNHRQFGTILSLVTTDGVHIDNGTDMYFRSLTIKLRSSGMKI